MASVIMDEANSQANNGTSSHGPFAPTSAQTIAEQIVTAVVPSGVLRASEPPGPLPMLDLRALFQDTSMVYSMARVDRWGTVAARSILDTLGWRPGNRLSIRPQRDLVIVHLDARGTYSLPRKPVVAIPFAARNSSHIHTGDTVLLAATPAHSILIIHGTSAINTMMTLYHRDERA